jgi:hypothetical protein
MKTSGKLAGVSVLAVLLSTSAFADSRHLNQTPSRESRDERVTMQGKVTAMSHENGGYRVRIDRDSRSYWVPDSYVRNNNGRDLRVGVSISLGGVFRGGSVYVDAVNWPDAGGYGYDNGYLRGLVTRIDYRRNIMTVRDDRSGRQTDVEMRGNQRGGRVDLDDLRRGDYVELSGDWTRGGLFEAYRVESVRNGRY